MKGYLQNSNKNIILVFLKKFIKLKLNSIILIDKYAEIWTTIWSPTDNNTLVTASEDQTCLIWDLKQRNAELKYKLTGHANAVTSVDWKVILWTIKIFLGSLSSNKNIKNDFFKDKPTIKFLS